MITIYKITDYTKLGKLKKQAKPVYAIDNNGNYEGIAQRIKDNGFTQFSSPYVFTHIDAVHPTHGPVRIYQDTIVNGHTFMTTPSKLYEALIK